MASQKRKEPWSLGFDEIGPDGCGTWVNFEDVADARPVRGPARKRELTGAAAPDEKGSSPRR